ncbi:hypothetical protein V8F20_007504 [Naviculisporaceae sp. PSN 640]
MVLQARERRKTAIRWEPPSQFDVTLQEGKKREGNHQRSNNGVVWMAGRPVLDIDNDRQPGSLLFYTLAVLSLSFLRSDLAYAQIHNVNGISTPSSSRREFPSGRPDALTEVSCLYSMVNQFRSQLRAIRARYIEVWLLRMWSYRIRLEVIHDTLVTTDRYDQLRGLPRRHPASCMKQSPSLLGLRNLAARNSGHANKCLSPFSITR